MWAEGDAVYIFSNQSRHNHSLPGAGCLAVDLTVNPFGATNKNKSKPREYKYGLKDEE